LRNTMMRSSSMALPRFSQSKLGATGRGAEWSHPAIYVGMRANDSMVVLKAIKQNPEALQYASDYPMSEDAFRAAATSIIEGRSATRPRSGSKHKQEATGIA
jgi:hypothetical protein